MRDFLQVVERNVTWLMRRPGSVHKTGGFRLSGGVESWTSPTLVSVRFNKHSELSQSVTHNKMSAEGDASRIVVPLMPSLSHIAAVRVAVPLYLGFSIETLKKACAEIEQGNATVPGQDNENDLHVKY
ncbi:hypothetical protein AVEN_132149-1, partial [Araneus ventricosus]